MKGHILDYLKTSLVLIVLFFATVYIRFTYVNYNFPTDNSSNTNIVSKLENFFKRGLATCYYSPMQNWHNKGDRLVTFYSRLQGSKGENYYVSHPPYTFLLSYVIFKAIDIYPSQFALQMTGLLLHFLGAVFIYMIVLVYFDKKGLPLYFPALISFVTYAFIPVLMYLHLFDAFSAIFIQPIWLISIYFILKLFKTYEKVNVLKLFGLATLIFITIYTDWVGIFLSVSVGFICLYYRKRERKYMKIFYTTLISSLISVMLIVIQYCQIEGLQLLLHNLKDKFIEQNYFLGNNYSDWLIGFLNPQSLLLLIKQIHNIFYGFGYLFLAMFLIVIYFQIQHEDYSFILSRDAKNLFILSVIPPVMYFLFYFNVSIIHYIYIAKFSVPISIFTGVIYEKLIMAFPLKKTKHLVIVFAFIKVIVIVVSIYIFLVKTPYDKNLAYLSEIANIIKLNSNENEAVFVNIKTKAYNPFVFLSLETKKNLIYADNIYQAKKLLSERNMDHGVFYTFVQKNHKQIINHFEIYTQKYQNTNIKIQINSKI